MTELHKNIKSEQAAGSYVFFNRLNYSGPIGRKYKILHKNVQNPSLLKYESFCKLAFVSLKKKNMRDPSMEQTASGLSTTHGIDGMLKASTEEKQILRSLAKQVAELACRDIEKDKAMMWTHLNDLKPVRPLVFCDPENGWNEIITQKEIRCKNPLLRVWEMNLRKEIFWGAKMNDDRVIEPYFNIPFHYSDSGYGVHEGQKHEGGEGGSFKYIVPIEDYQADFQKLTYPELKVDFERTNEIKEFAQSILGDILKVRVKGVWWWSLGLTWEFIKLRGLENLMLDMLVNPDGVHQLMGFLSDATLQKLNFLENSGLLSSNTEGTYVGSGGFGWTTQLPKPNESGPKVYLKDMWGFCESQETVGVDPALFNEFILPYQMPILEKFGLNCYGCCEPLDSRWEYVSTIPNLRRVSVSPWAGMEKMAEYLRNNYIYSRKPSPTDLADPNPDWIKIRRELRDFFKKTRDCRVEIIMKDNHTLGNNPDNAVNWCKIAMEEARKV